MPSGASCIGAGAGDGQPVQPLHHDPMAARGYSGKGSDAGNAEVFETRGRLAAAARRTVPLEWGPKNGAHVHILLHVPPRLDSDFSLMPLRWTKRILPGGYVKNTLDSKKLPGANAPDNVSREVYRHALWARLHYVLKAAPPALEGKLGLTGCGHAQWGRSSRVYGQRAGSWQVRRKPNQA